MDGEEDYRHSTLVLKNLPFQLKHDKLLAQLNTFAVKPSYIRYYHDGRGMFKGIAFVKYKSPEAAEQGKALLDGIDIGGRKVRVEYKQKQGNADTPPPDATPNGLVGDPPPGDLPPIAVSDLLAICPDAQTAQGTPAAPVPQRPQPQAAPQPIQQTQTHTAPQQPATSSDSAQILLQQLSSPEVQQRVAAGQGHTLHQQAQQAAALLQAAATAGNIDLNTLSPEQLAQAAAAAANITATKNQQAAAYQPQHAPQPPPPPSPAKAAQSAAMATPPGSPQRGAFGAPRGQPAPVQHQVPPAQPGAVNQQQLQALLAHAQAQYPNATPDQLRALVLQLHQQTLAHQQAQRVAEQQRAAMAAQEAQPQLTEAQAQIMAEARARLQQLANSIKHLPADQQQLIIQQQHQVLREQLQARAQQAKQGQAQAQAQQLAMQQRLLQQQLQGQQAVAPQQTPGPQVPAAMQQQAAQQVAGSVQQERQPQGGTEELLLEQLRQFNKPENKANPQARLVLPRQVFSQQKIEQLAQLCSKHPNLRLSLTPEYVVVARRQAGEDEASAIAADTAAAAQHAEAAKQSQTEPAEAAPSVDNGNAAAKPEEATAPSTTPPPGFESTKDKGKDGKEPKEPRSRAGSQGKEPPEVSLADGVQGPFKVDKGQRGKREERGKRYEKEKEEDDKRFQFRDLRGVFKGAQKLAGMLPTHTTVSPGEVTPWGAGRGRVMVKA
eukprot:NODE_193_length_2367_cov_81.247768_g187_i0.p1 GENE.NODE_193_length_2367_cov_81.247768_g187_i0~~NODE_193_length_2367_cov_81.247768_g187_i0.p1  ORF type:complete len:718 (-),score=191.95 NODE_193_length_2367_cov_81.247768_g187_i0:136-2289(-)